MARIYVADDDPDVKAVVAYTLGDAGHEITTFSDGASVRASTVADPPDLLVLDVMMPGLDGLQVLEFLRGWRFDAWVRVLILTARASEQDWSRAFELGADRFMTKPFDPDELTAAVGELLAFSPKELRERRDKEADRARLLYQLEDLFGEA